MLGKIKNIFKIKVAYAHCDIPCGIYDPHHAQMAAHTVIRMIELINELPKIVPAMTPEQRENALHKFQRYTMVKEQHAEICKHEVRILWGDYFKPEHAQQHPELHDLVWKVMKLGSRARQEIDMKAAEELLETVNKIAEIFWKTKNVQAVKRKSFYVTERDIVLPKA